MENSSIISHLSLGTNDFERAVAFYDRILPTLGCQCIMKEPGAVAYGKQLPEFWIQTPIDGQPATVGKGTHVGFIALNKAAVHAFIEAAYWDMSLVEAQYFTREFFCWSKPQHYDREATRLSRKRPATRPTPQPMAIATAMVPVSVPMAAPNRAPTPDGLDLVAFAATVEGIELDGDGVGGGHQVVGAGLEGAASGDQISSSAVVTTFSP